MSRFNKSCMVTIVEKEYENIEENCRKLEKQMSKDEFAKDVDVLTTKKSLK